MPEKRYGSNYGKGHESYLTYHDLDLCGRIVHELTFGIDRPVDPHDIAAYLSERLHVPEATIAALSERLYVWLEQSLCKECLRNVTLIYDNRCEDCKRKADDQSEETE